MSVEMAAQLLLFANIPSKSTTILTGDDCAIFYNIYITGRGVSVIALVEKCVGSLAETVASLQVQHH